MTSNLGFPDATDATPLSRNTRYERELPEVEMLQSLTQTVNM